MALRAPRPSRVVLPAIALVVTAVLSGMSLSGVAAAAPDAPASTLDVVAIQKQLGELALTNSLLVDKFDTARVQLESTQRAAAKARAAASIAAANYARAQDEMSRTAVARYESGAFSATGALLSSDSGSNYLAHIATLDMISTHLEQGAQLMANAKASADAAVKQADQLASDARARSADLIRQRHKADAQFAKYRDELTRLDAHARWQYQRMIVPQVSDAQLLKAKATLALTASPAALKAVRYALAQVGKPYVFGAAGPDAFDCSGLTMQAWAQSDVHLPHSSEIQYTMGTSVADVSQAQPGDLIFLYGSSPSHVTIYAGSGLMVSAPTEGETVSVVPVSAFASDIVGVRRFG